MKRVILITGVSKGLGAALAQRFRTEGFLVAGCARTAPDMPLDLFIAADVTDEPQRKRLITTVIETFGRLDVLVNNAGIGLYIGWEEMEEHDLRAAFELNFFAPVALARRALPHLAATGGTLINVSSVAGMLPLPYMGGYNATKYALNAFSDSFRPEIARHGVTLLNLVIGRIATGFGDRALGGKATPATPGVTTAAQFADAVWQAYRTGDRELIFPGWYRWAIRIRRIAPAWFDRLAMRRWDG